MLRKLETQEEKERKEKRRTWLLSGLMLLILLGSTAGYAFLSGEKTTTNKVTKGIVDLGGSWKANFNGQDLIFASSPDVVNNASMNFSYEISNYYQKPVYIVSNDSSASYEVASTLGKYALRFQEACYGPCQFDFPQKNCTDFMIVYNKIENVSRIYQKDNCIFIEGNLSSVDAFLYRAFGLA